MKKIYALVLPLAFLFSCADTKKQEKDLLEQVIAVHDSVMAKDDKLMKNKIQLDTLVKTHKDTSAIRLMSALDAADARMEDWMHKFDAENKGKSHDEIMKYLEDQQKQIKNIDKQFDSVINVSSQYISSVK